MNNTSSDYEQRLTAYVNTRDTPILILHQIGFGNDGIVWSTNLNSAIKVFYRESNYNREIGCYLRLEDLRIEEVEGFAVPTLIDFDDDLWILEIKIVSPPYLIDFGKAYLDIPPDYSEETIAYWEVETKELYGARWDQVESALLTLRSYGIHYYDAKPGNIQFADVDS